MNNPFETIDNRLSNIENLLISLKESSNSNQSSGNDQPITTKQLCVFLGVTEPTIIRWRKKGKIPFIQIGSAIRFNLAAVMSALEVNKKVKR